MATIVSTTKPTSWKPTRKWLAATLTAIGTLALLAIDSGFGADFQKAVVGVVVIQGAAYLVPNNPANPASGSEA
jgi:hypothetical protein